MQYQNLLSHSLLNPFARCICKPFPDAAPFFYFFIFFALLKSFNKYRGGKKKKEKKRKDKGDTGPRPLSEHEMIWLKKSIAAVLGHAAGLLHVTRWDPSAARAWA